AKANGCAKQIERRTYIFNYQLAFSRITQEAGAQVAHVTEHLEYSGGEWIALRQPQACAPTPKHLDFNLKFAYSLLQDGLSSRQIVQSLLLPPSMLRCSIAVLGSPGLRS
ncbi:hypothetical protein GGF42_002405, partial [Coemansia sp. RSA 2424]